MLELKKIVKDYPVANTTVRALKGVDLQFRSSEFVSVLGPSGCGKTTLLNIIGGLDKYTTGDLVIDGVSTKDYKDRDWDTYRNHTIGFVFQTYNLIPHQTVLKNVELALTLAGVPKSERKPRAEEALRKVGLGEHIHKRPNQLSGGQMQRVAIARALVNDPSIILADEPTGALDTETGMQIMDLLQEMSNDRLVIMVTHNPDLAHKYSSRIIEILDGEIVSDSKPVSEEELQRERELELRLRQNDAPSDVAAEMQVPEAAETVPPAENYRPVVQRKKSKNSTRGRKKRSSMSFWTAFKLSLNNLFTKKGRTVLTSFAGSIGIIGIALILAVSQGMTNYINLVEEQTLSGYPLTIEATAMDLTAMMQNMMDTQQDKPTHDRDRIYKRSMIYDLVNMVSGSAQKSNDLRSFKKFIEDEVAKEDSPLHDAIAGLSYNYNLNLNVYTKNIDGEIIECDVGNLMRELLTIYLENVEASTGQYYMGLSSFSMDIWQEMLSGNDGSPVNDLIKDQYELINGEWPKEYNDVVLIANSNNEISDVALYALGLIGQDYIDAVADAIRDNTNVKDPGTYNNWSYEDICDTKVRVILDSSCYRKVGDVWTDMRDMEGTLDMLYGSGLELNICGIIRPNPDATAHMLSGTIGYTKALTEYVVQQAEMSEAVQEQKLHEDVDIFTGLPFASGAKTLSDAEKQREFTEYFEGLPLNGDLTETSQKLVFAQMLALDNMQTIEQTADAQLEAFAASGMLKTMISNMMAQQYGVPADAIAGYLEAMTDEELKELVRPSMVEMQKEQYVAQRWAEFAQLSDDKFQERVSTYEATEEQFAAYYDEILEFSEATFEGNLQLLGSVDLDKPVAINIYASSFEAKDVIAAEIERYNQEFADEDSQITYTDLVALVMTAVTTIVNAVTYVLIAFVAISLIVSSIMIGVITLISVQERTKEIGILRAIGASKRDVSSMFNAETVIIGFAAGLIGVLATYLLCIPINIILQALTGIAGLKAVLPPLAALILVAISVVLTLFSGLIPSRSAAKKDPVVALRTE